MELHHVNVKLRLKEPKALDLAALIPVFHSWIQGQVCEERLLDVADYRHVHAGPGVVLIGLEADYSVDNSDLNPGIRYNRKAALEGDNQHRLKQAARAALTACQRLESEASLGGKLSFNGQDVEVFINDRLLAPNCDETRGAVKADFQSFFEKLFAGTEYSLSHESDPRKLFAVAAKSARRFSAAELIRNLEA